MLYGQPTADVSKQDREYHILNIRLNPNLHTSLHQIAAERGETVASTVREMLRRSIAEPSQVSR